MKTKLIRLLPVVLIPLLFSGCVIAMGNRDLGRPPAAAGTMGQELIDLEKAKAQGLLTDAEYSRLRSRILGEPAPK